MQHRIASTNQRSIRMSTKQSTHATRRVRRGTGLRKTVGYGAETMSTRA